MTDLRNDMHPYAVLFLILMLVIAFWFPLRYQQAVWIDTPPVPSENAALAFALGDKQMAYRSFGIMLQNVGNTGGRTLPLNSYDFETLSKWFWLEDELDATSNYVPILAAYYFGGTPDTDQLDPIIEYLGTIGQRSEGQKWRWLAHAVYLARFKQNDLDKALELSYVLASMKDRVDLPQWASHMPAFIMAQKGDKQAALNMLIGILKQDAEKMHPNEVNFTVSYICEKVLSAEEAATYPLCVSRE